MPDLRRYSNLADFIEKNSFDYVAGIGLNLTHIVSLESPLDLSQPILRQRRFAWFRSDGCKPLITRVPLRWCTGFHACDQPIDIDPNLFVLHLKTMDYDLALKKQRQIER